MVISIVNAEYRGKFKIYFEFSDGKSREIDFYELLANAKNPMTKKYLDEELFKAFSLEFGDIQWNDFELCFPIWDLYEGNL